MGRDKLPKDQKVYSHPMYLRLSEKQLIIAEHGSLKAWALYEIARLRKKSAKKVA